MSIAKHIIEHEILGIRDPEIPQLDSDPVSPDQQTAWVLKTFTAGGVGAGEPYGLLLSLTQPGDGATTAYQFSYRTIEGATVRANLT